MLRRDDLTQEIVKEYFRYNPTTGIIKWRKKPAIRVQVNDIADNKGSDGYVYLRFKGNTYRAHRVIWLYMRGYWPENDIDHENRIKDDNRWDNLREVSRSCNMRNRGVLRNNKSGVTGVRWIKNRNKWVADIRVNKKLRDLGYHKNFNNAVKARHEAEVKYGWPSCNSTSPAYLYLKENNLLEV